MINSAKHYNGLVKIYLMKCSWLNGLLAKVGTIPDLNFDTFDICDEDKRDQLPQIHMGISVYHADADDPQKKYVP